MKYTYIIIYCCIHMWSNQPYTSLTYLPHFVELLLGSHHLPTLGGALRDDPGMAWDAAPATSRQGDGGPNGHRHLQPQVRAAWRWRGDDVPVMLAEYQPGTIGTNQFGTNQKTWLVGRFGWFFHINMGIIIPTDNLFFSGRGWNHQPGNYRIL